MTPGELYIACVTCVGRDSMGSDLPWTSFRYAAKDITTNDLRQANVFDKWSEAVEAARKMGGKVITLRQAISQEYTKIQDAQEISPL